jgi:hypothetical protein
MATAAGRLACIALVLLQPLAGCAASASAGPEEICAPATASGSPASIVQAIALANDLFTSHPGQVTLPCFVESLDRPLATLATASVFSAQPAIGRRSPRIFLFSGPLVMSVVPDGEAAALLELAEYTSPTRSIKAEVLFPLRAPLAATAPYDRVRFNSGTTCGSCHGTEVTAKGVSLTHAFESDVLRPRTQEEVSPVYLEDETRNCDSRKEPMRCEMLDAVFGHGAVTTEHFSPDARTIYGD